MSRGPRCETKRWTPSGGFVADRQPRYRPAAQAELIEAATRYEAASEGLGADFIKAIDDALAVVVASPERWA